MEYVEFSERYMLEFDKMLGDRATASVLESFCKANYQLSKNANDFNKNTVWSNASELLEDKFSPRGIEYRKARFLERLYGKDKIPKKVIDLSIGDLSSRFMSILLQIPVHESIITFMSLLGIKYDGIITFVTFGSTLLSHVSKSCDENITSYQLTMFSASSKSVFAFLKSRPIGHLLYSFITHERSAECDLAFFKFIREFPPFPEIEEEIKKIYSISPEKCVFLDDYLNEIFAEKFEYVGDRGPEKNKLLRNICKRTRQKIIESKVLES